MQIEGVPGRGLSKPPPGPGWAGKRPKIDDFRSHDPNKNLKIILIALASFLGVGVTFGDLITTGLWMSSRRPPSSLAGPKLGT